MTPSPQLSQHRRSYISYKPSAFGDSWNSVCVMGYCWNRCFRIENGRQTPPVQKVGENPSVGVTLFWHLFDFSKLNDFHNSWCNFNTLVIPHATYPRSIAVTDLYGSPAKGAIEAVLVHGFKSEVAFLDERGSCESCVFIMLDVLTKLRVLTHLINLS